MRYLIEFRFRGHARRYAKNLIYKVSRKFKVKEVEVPHISLFGPCQTNDEKRLVSEIISVGKKYELVPFRIDGFYFFNNHKNKVIYLDIIPSEKLDSLRKDIANKLLKFTVTTDNDKKPDFIFHATIAFKDIDSKFEKIWEFIQKQPKPYIHQHLLRITIIKNNKILYEYDLMQKKLLTRPQALSKLYWNITIKLLKQKTSDFKDDIDNSIYQIILDKLKRFFKKIKG